LRTLEDVDEVAIVAVPDALIRPMRPVRKQTPPPPPPSDPCLPGEPEPPDAEPPAPRWVERAPEFSADQIESVQQALILHCKSQRDRIALLDPPIFSARGQSLGADAVQGWRRRFDSQYAALYFPWPLVYDPLKLNGSVVRAIPPSGHVAGIYARTDVESGVHRAPANVELRWAAAVVEDVTPELQGVLNPAGINCLRTLAGRGLRVYGARTISSDGLWRFVNVRRLMMMIEEAIETAIQWSVFEPHDLELRRSLITAISSFLDRMWQRGALVGATADEAFFVKCDEENNPPDQVNLGQLIVEIGVAPVRPAEFIVVRVGKTVDGLELTELGETIGTGAAA
jgi:phage tail sheath protein FI